MAKKVSRSQDSIVLSLCMIVRENAKTLRPCLQSIRPWVDEMVIINTGSKDETPQIVEQFGGRLLYFPWVDNFSAARNESLNHARGKWLFWMDSDDTIDEENSGMYRTDFELEAEQPRRAGEFCRLRVCRRGHRLQ